VRHPLSTPMKRLSEPSDSEPQPRGPGRKSADGTRANGLMRFSGTTTVKFGEAEE
jgi:hypothetical protein